MVSFYDSKWKKFETDLIKSSIEEQLEGFGHLDNNWRVMNEGEPIPQNVIELTRKIYFNLRNLNFNTFEVQPGLSGEVLLEAQYADNAVELIVNKDLSLEYFLEINGVEIEPNVDLSLKNYYRS